jgi:hypothetical protein
MNCDFLFFSIFFEFQRVWDGSDGLDSRVGSGTDMTGWTGQVGSNTSFFQIFLSVHVLDPSILMDHGSDEFEHGSRRWTRPRFVSHPI